MRNKYFIIFLQNIHDLLAYRVRLAVIILDSFVSPIIIMLILSSLPSGSISGFTQDDIVRYYLATGILYLFLNSKIDGYVKESIQQGELANYIVKPTKFWLVALIKDTSGRILRLIIGIPIFLTLLVLFHLPIVLHADTLLPIAAMVSISFFMAFTISFCVGLLAFWSEEVWGIQNLKDVMITLLSGAALPYVFFPASLQSFLVYTPFPYLINWPLRQGFSGSFQKDLIIASTWLCLLIFVSWRMWKAGLRKYSALGTY